VEVPAELTQALTRLVTAGSGTSFVLLGADGLLRYASPGALEPLGFTAEEAAGWPWSDLLWPEDLLAWGAPSPAPIQALVDRAQQQDAAAVAGGSITGHLLVRLRTRDGLVRHVDLVVLDARADPEVRGVLTVGRDVTAPTLAAATAAVVGTGSLRAAVDRVAGVLGDVLAFDRLVLAGVDEGGLRVLAVSGADLRPGVIGAAYTLEEAALLRLHRTSHHVVRDTADPAAGDPRARSAGVGSYVSAGVPLAGQTVGTLTLTHARPRAFRSQDAALLAEVAALAGVSLLLLAQLEQEQAATSALLERTNALVQRASSDALTGLANRSRLLEALAAALEGAQGVGLLFCDLDRFKVVNDALGHHVGDALLGQIAARLRAAVEPGSLVARIGGDEFVVLVPAGATAAGLLELGARLQRVVAEPVPSEHHLLRVDLSAGAVLAQPGDSADLVLQHADTAMYKAKGGGRRRVALYTDAVGAEARERFDLERDLAHALGGGPEARGQIGVVYQPVVDLRTGGWTGVEVLARWQHPTLGAVPPTMFVPLAEEVGLTGRLTSIVTAQAFAAWSSWRRTTAGCALTVGLNVSGRDLVDAGVLDDIADRLAEADLPAAQLVLEVTETALARAGEDAVDALERLRARGTELALDDFGTGYSSLAHLRQLPVTTLKVDRSFISGPGDGDDPDLGLADLPLVRAFVALAESLRLPMVAEGVETDRQAAELRALGCTLGQGWALSRPLSADAVAVALSRRTAEGAGDGAGDGAWQSAAS